MSWLQLSARCKLFEEIADKTWVHVIRNHAVGTEVSEVGVTNDIVAEIRTAHAQNGNIGVWANNGWREIDHGSDIDIFVEVLPGQFVWWALQAKVLKLNGTYDVGPKQGDRPQWQKLEDLARNSGCMPMYLLYNGVADYRYQGKDGCGRLFTQEQFGCSLVEPMEIARVHAQRTPRFRDFHPVPAQPWRIITCCYARVSQLGLTIYTAAQIKDAVDHYQPVAGNTTAPAAPAVAKEQDPLSKKSPLPVNAINTLSEENNREPMYRIVIRTTSSLNEQS